MIVYQDTASNFINQCKDAANDISEIISEDMIKSGIPNFNDSQKRAWQFSLPAMARVLEKSTIDGDIKVAVEYKIRQSKDRIDFIIYGNSESNRAVIVIIELKQWSNASRSNRKDYVIVNGGHGLDEYRHPSYQAYNYANLMSNFNEYIQKNNVSLSACSYLHNMDNGNAVLMNNIELFPLVQDAPVYLKDDEDKLADFISRYIKHGNPDLLYEVENSRIVPSKHLSDMLTNALKGNDFFSYDESQAFAVSEIVKTVQEALYYNEKKTIIIKGGPGTGKSVVAINALGQLLSGRNGEKCNAVYVTANAAPRYLYTDELIGNDYKKTALSNLFKDPATFKIGAENVYDCALLDEAHRIYDYKGGRGIKGGTHILDNIIKGSRVNVFFIDEDQAVTKDDYATIEIINNLAYKYHSRVISEKKLELTSQFRVCGGEDYISFIKGFLGYEGYVPEYHESKSYEFRVFDSASEMMDEIIRKDALYKKEGKSGRCRIVAGYDYEWLSQGKPRESDLFDIVLDNGMFRAKWNLKRDGGYSWLNDPDSVREVGCIHTCQGLDMNYCGVILGKDIRFENGKICFHKEAIAKSDKSSGIRNADDRLAEKLIRNTYNVFLTRGMCGTFVYCENEPLSNYLKKIIGKN